MRALALLCLALPPAAGLPDEPQPGWFGAALEAIEIPAAWRELAGGASAGIRLASVVPGGPADRTGLAAGDVLVELGAGPLTGAPAEELASFVARLAASEPGDRLDVTLLRGALRVEGRRDGEPHDDVDAGAWLASLDDLPVGSSVELRAARALERRAHALVLGRQPSVEDVELPSNAALAPDGRWPGDFGELGLAQRLRRLVRAEGLDEPTDDLLARLAALHERGDRSRIPPVVLAHRAPLRALAIAERLAGTLEAAAALPTRRYVEAAGVFGGAATGRPPPEAGAAPVAPASGGGGALALELDALERCLAMAVRFRDLALADLTEDEREHLRLRWLELSERFEQHIYLFADPDEARRRRHERTVAIGERVRRGALFAAAIALQPLTAEDLSARLLAAAEADGVDPASALVASRTTPFGEIVIAGTGDDVHREGTLALLVDLGGDDVYSNNVASTVGHDETPALAVAAIVDAAGDDAYEATHRGSIAFGLLGVGLLLDRSGDDSYVGLRWTQGAGFCGVGLLLDLEGDDRYRAHAFAQGAGLHGLGLLADLDGDDRYEAHRYAQGLGLAGGAGVLHDVDGADEYWCKGTYPSSYGTPGVFEGWGQGCGVGFRGNASGGFGLLLDGGGADRYEAGNFAQGGGYYHAFGALLDRGDADDVYVGSRYDQGFSAHQAVGVFRESGGDDVYRTRFAVAHGLAWDESVTLFVEDGGDDDYGGGGFSLGASAHNALSVFWERDGRDRYRVDQLARAHPNDYHGGTSLSFFLDEGRDEDRYVDPERNGAVRVSAEHSLFVDR